MSAIAAIGAETTSATGPVASPPPAPAPAEERAAASTVDLRLGAFLLSGIKVNLALDTPRNPSNGGIDVTEKLVGETTATTFRFDASWVISGPHMFDASWYDIDLDGLRTITEEFEFGDTVYPVGATVESSYRTTIYKIAYGFAFYRKNRHELAGLIGAHVMRLETSIGMPERNQFERFAITAPMPAVGIQWRAHWNEKFSTRASFQWFGISIEDDKYSGHFTDILFAAEYRFFERGGLGAGYNQFDLRTRFAARSNALHVDYSYGGLLAYLFANF